MGMKMLAKEPCCGVRAARGDKGAEDEPMAMAREI